MNNSSASGGSGTEKFFVAGIWLILSLPISGLIVFLTGNILDIRLHVGIDDPRLIFAFFAGLTLSGSLWARSLLQRAGMNNNSRAVILSGAAFAAVIVGAEVFGLFDTVVDGLEIRGNVPMEFAVFFISLERVGSWAPRNGTCARIQGHQA